MSSERPIIAAAGLIKRYALDRNPLRRLLGRSRQDWTALDDISFEVQRGEAVAIIGRNGSGKSTLLQLISGISQPSAGSLSVAGRITALLELGAGFHPEMTGRENVFMLAAILGIDRRSAAASFDAIVGFAELGSHIDQPVKTYSSGMFVRLAFAAATHFHPDILVIDEALAVGDALFQKRCHARIRELVRDGVTLLFVSHDHELVRTLTSRTLLLDQGRMLYWGDTREGTRRYRAILFEHEARLLAQSRSEGSLPESVSGSEANAYGVGGARLVGVRIGSGDGEARNVFVPGETIEFRLEAVAEVELEHLNLSIVIRRDRGEKMYSWGTLNQDMATLAGKRQGSVFWHRSFRPGELITTCIRLKCRLGPGNYEVQGVVSRELEPNFLAQQILHWRDEACFFRVLAPSAEHIFGGLCDLEAVSHHDA